MTKIAKKVLWLAYEQESFANFRKIIFKNGMSVQDFFSHIITIVNNMDEESEFLLKKIKNIKLEKIKNKKEEKVVEDMFYEMFEEKFK